MEILSGSHKSIFNGNYNVYDVYDMGILWQLIPKSMRQWWIEEVKKTGGDDGPYATVTINEPSAVFEDKKIDYNMFLDYYHSDKLYNVVQEINNKNIINANFICPCSCLKSCR